MIYLFCTKGFGQLFMENFLNFSKANKVSCVIVMSAKGTPNRNFLISSLRGFVHSRRNGLKTIFIKDINCNSFINSIPRGSIGIVSGFNQIFGKDIINQFNKLVNFHPSLLPYYRGPVPSYWCIKNGETKTGYTLHEITEKIDEGEILFQGIVNIDPEDDDCSLDLKISKRASLKLVPFLDSIMNHTSWDNVILNAKEIYKNHVGYKSFPNNR